MITINLLPPELRRRSGPPLRMLAFVAGATAVVTSLLAVWAWLAFGSLAEVESRRSQLALEMDGLRPRLQYHKALEAETKVASAREAKLTAITQDRILWTEKVDDLIDVVASGNDVDHFIWFDDLVVKPGGQVRGGQQAPGSLSLSAHSGSDQDPRSGFDKTGRFLNALADPDISGFMADFEGVEREGVIRSVKRSEEDKERIPAVHWSFPLTLQLKESKARWEAHHPQETRTR